MTATRCDRAASTDYNEKRRVNVIQSKWELMNERIFYEWFFTVVFVATRLQETAYTTTCNL